MYITYVCCVRVFIQIYMQVYLCLHQYDNGIFNNRKSPLWISLHQRKQVLMQVFREVKCNVNFRKAGGMFTLRHFSSGEGSQEPSTFHSRGYKTDRLIGHHVTSSSEIILISLSFSIYSIIFFRKYFLYIHLEPYQTMLP